MLFLLFFIMLFLFNGSMDVKRNTSIRRHSTRSTNLCTKCSQLNPIRQFVAQTSYSRMYAAVCLCSVFGLSFSHSILSIAAYHYLAYSIQCYLFLPHCVCVNSHFTVNSIDSLRTHQCNECMPFYTLDELRRSCFLGGLETQMVSRKTALHLNSSKWFPFSDIPHPEHSFWKVFFSNFNNMLCKQAF